MHVHTYARTPAPPLQAVDRAKQLKFQCQQLEEQAGDAARLREELARVQQQLGMAHGTCSALRSQLKAAKEQREEEGAAHERRLRAQVRAHAWAGRCIWQKMAGLQGSHAPASQEKNVLHTARHQQN